MTSRYVQKLLLLTNTLETALRLYQHFSPNEGPARDALETRDAAAKTSGSDVEIAIRRRQRRRLQTFAFRKLLEWVPLLVAGLTTPARTAKARESGATTGVANSTPLADNAQLELLHEVLAEQQREARQALAARAFVASVDAEHMPKLVEVLTPRQSARFLKLYEVIHGVDVPAAQPQRPMDGEHSAPRHADPSSWQAENLARSANQTHACSSPGGPTS